VSKSTRVSQLLSERFWAPSVVAAALLIVAACGGGATDGSPGTPGTTGSGASPGATGAGSGATGLAEEAIATVSVVLTGSSLDGTYRTTRAEEAVCGRGEEGGRKVARIRFKAAIPGPRALAEFALDVPDVSKGKGANVTIKITKDDGSLHEIVLVNADTITYTEIGTGYTIRGKVSQPDGTLVDLRLSCGPF